jgi:hypothetical protein
VASYHLSLHPNVSRGKGQSLVRTAAYNGRTRLEDERTGEVWNYRRLGTALAEGLYAPQGAPDWARDLGRLVNEIERFEKRSDAQLAMNLDIALPYEQTLEQNRRLMQDFVREQFQRKGYAAHFAIHPPDRDGDERNIHAHVLVTLRQIGPDGFARSKAEQQERYRNRGAYVEGLRDAWEKLANRHLERNGHDARIDRRSLEDQRIEREPEQHRGPGVTAMERQGDVTRIGDHIRLRQHHYAELKELAAEERQIDAEIIDLQAARAEREAARGQVAGDDLQQSSDLARDPSRSQPAERGIAEFPASPENAQAVTTTRPIVAPEPKPGRETENGASTPAAEFSAAARDATAAREPTQAPERDAAPLAPDTANSAPTARESSPELEPAGIVGGLADGAVKFFGKALDVVAGMFESLFASPAPPVDHEQQQREVAEREEREAQAREAAEQDARLRATMEQQREQRRAEPSLGSE